MADDATATLVQEPAPPAPSPPVKAPDVKAAPAAKAEEGAKAENKDKKSKKGKQGENGEVGDGPSIAAHPRAARGVAQAKAWGALAGFTIGGYFSLPTATLADAGLRALLGGIACYMFAWGASVFFWRRAVMIEIRSREQQVISAMQAAHGEGPAGEHARAA